MLNIAHKDKMVKLCNRLVYLFSIVFLMVTDFPKHTWSYDSYDTYGTYDLVRQ